MNNLSPTKIFKKATKLHANRIVTIYRYLTKYFIHTLTSYTASLHIKFADVHFPLLYRIKYVNISFLHFNITKHATFFLFANLYIVYTMKFITLHVSITAIFLMYYYKHVTNVCTIFHSI